MMTNLFSIFDPCTSIFSMKLNWMSTVLGLMMMPSSFWIMNNRYMLTLMKPTKMLNNEFKMLINKMNNKGTTLIFISMFMMIMLNNLLGLYPYLFTSTSHLVLSLSMALPLWLGFMLMGWTKKTKNMFIHLVPVGTPSILMPFMVCIETISNMIRPGTLAVRLTANMIAGHLIMTLLGNTMSSVSMSTLVLTISIQMLLLMLEGAVAIIQGYVMAVLSILYSSEIN